MVDSELSDEVAMDKDATLPSTEIPATGAGLDARIDAMFMRDKIAASLLVVVLWLVVFFVMLAIRPYFPKGPVEIVCWIGAAILLVFNSASIFAMIRHYAEDKRHIYGVDIRHLDAGR